MDISHRRDRLYQYALLAATAFAIVCCVVLVVFKRQETYWDVIMRGYGENQQEKAQETSAQWFRRNLTVEYLDEEGAVLRIPLAARMDTSMISMQEEFLSNKLVVTLKGAADCIADGTQVTSDSTCMEAVGFYRQKEDIVIELYAKTAYEYTIENKEQTLTISLEPIRELYDWVAVLYLPYGEKEQYGVAEWQEELDKFAETSHGKIYASWQQQERYTQQEVVAFANQIHADLLLGAETVQSGQEKGVTAICNSEYFIPDFGSVELAVCMLSAFTQELGYVPEGIAEWSQQQPLVGEATVAGAMVIIDAPGKEDLQEQYAFSRMIMTAFQKTLEQAIGEHEKK